MFFKSIGTIATNLEKTRRSMWVHAEALRGKLALIDMELLLFQEVKWVKWQQRDSNPQSLSW